MKGQFFKKVVSTVLAASMTVTMCMSGVSALAAEAEPTLPTLTVDMAQSGRSLKHGAAGWLYGLGSDGVPSANTITPLKPHTAVQKAPNGMQHPNGDVLDVAKTYLDAGGKHLQIYMPDYYALWFYEFTGTDYYLDIVRMQAQACIDAGIEDDVVYVPYNEPNANWVGEYVDHDGNKVTGWTSLYYFWEAMLKAINEVYEENGVTTKPKTAGLNLAGYNNGVMEDYIKFCVENNCMPDVISWHDLSTGQFNNFGNEYNHYRSLETKYLTAENAEKYGVDITPREIVINEYAAQAECASPGNLIRWIGLWEEFDVNGCLPFWHLSNNLNGLAADNNTGNGAWWLYKWYGDMSGDYLPVAVSNARKDTFYGVASLDENKKSSNVVFGGVSGDSNIVIANVNDSETFANAEKVHIKVEATDYTGFHGVAEEPRVVKEGAVKVVNGSITVPMSGMNALSAYNITITQAADEEPIGLLGSTWKALYEAENGVLSGNARVSNTDGTFAGSGRKKVDMVDTANDKVALTVNVPSTGYYKYDMVYCAATGCNTGDPSKNTPYTAIQTLTIDEREPLTMTLPTTLNWSMGGMYSTYIWLEAGSHTLTIAGSDSKGKAVPDCVYLTYEGSEEADISFDNTYEAELGEFNEIKGEATTLTTVKDGSIGYITGLEKRSVTEGGGVRFTVVVPDNGMYSMKLRYAADADTTVNVYMDNDMVNLDNLRTTVTLPATQGGWDNAYQTLFLQKGINIIDLDAQGAMKLDYMNIRALDSSSPVATVEAEDGVLTGEAALGENEDVLAQSSGGYVGGIKAANGVELIPEDDPEFTILGLGRVVDKGEAVDKNNLKINVNVPEAGEYKMAVYQSSGELFGKHSYNAQMSERYASFKVNDGEPQKVVFRNTYSDETFQSHMVTVTLEKGDNVITIYNDNSKVITNGVLKPGQSAHRPENIDYNVLTNYTPNFDKFEFYSAVGESQPEEDLTYRVKTSYTEGGVVTTDRTRVEKDGKAQLTFAAQRGSTLTAASINGENVMDKLTSAGGVIIVRNIATDLDVRAVFEQKAAPQREIMPNVDAGMYYFVDCGDIDPNTINSEEFYGLYNNGKTDRFYTPGTAEQPGWGVDDTYVDKGNGLLTGEKTWPFEQGGKDGDPKELQFRYAKDQPVSDVGVVYKFELPAGTYPVEMGFYVPSGWTNPSVPRTMKLLFNGAVIDENFVASNDYNKPVIKTGDAVVGEDGLLTIQVGHASNAVWGPVVSYIKIFNPDGKADTTILQKLYDAHKDKKPANYTEDSWGTFDTALKAAGTMLSNQEATQAQVNAAATALEDAALALVDYVNKDALQTLYDQNKERSAQDYTEESWQTFELQLANAAFLLGSDAAEQANVNAQLTKLQAAIDSLIVLVPSTVDKSLLKDSIDMANIAKENYPANLIETVKVKFEAALAHAIEVYNDTTDKYTQADVDAADDALVQMMQYLLFTADIDGLKAAIDHAKEVIDSGLYENDAMMEAYKKALADAEALLAEGNITDGEIQPAIQALADAEAKLNEAVIKLDLSSLQSEINKSNNTKLLLHLYFDGEKKDAFVAELAAAKALLAEAMATPDQVTQEQIDAQTSKLHAARAALRLIPNKDALKSLIDSANAIDQSLYTEASVRDLQAALNAANTVYADKLAGEAAVKNAENKLQNAIDGLVLRTGDGGNANQVDKNDGAQTGDTTNVVGLSVLLLLSLASAAVVLFRRRRMEEK